MSSPFTIGITGGSGSGKRFSSTAWQAVLVIVKFV
jgi:uridine kinase